MELIWPPLIGEVGVANLRLASDGERLAVNGVDLVIANLQLTSKGGELAGDGRRLTLARVRRTWFTTESTEDTETGGMVETLGIH